MHWGGGVYAEDSTVVVVDSVFEGCRAGNLSVSGDDDYEGAGGAIGVRPLSSMHNELKESSHG